MNDPKPNAGPPEVEFSGHHHVGSGDAAVIGQEDRGECRGFVPDRFNGDGPRCSYLRRAAFSARARKGQEPKPHKRLSSFSSCTSCRLHHAEGCDEPEHAGAEYNFGDRAGEERPRVAAGAAQARNEHVTVDYGISTIAATRAIFANNSVW